ncbi:hypothetical protein ABVT39_010818 [Epinephelus coioides]
MTEHQRSNLMKPMVHMVHTVLDMFIPVKNSHLLTKESGLCRETTDKRKSKRTRQRFVYIIYFCSHQIQGRQRKFGLQIAGGIESSCRGYSTWRHVNGSPDETYPSLNHNLSCSYWLLCDSVNDAKGALHQPQRRGECHRDLDSSAQVCSLQVRLMGITPCSHNYGQIIKTRDMLQSEAFKTKHATFLCCHFNSLFIKSCLLQQLTEQLRKNIVLSALICKNIQEL